MFSLDIENAGFNLKKEKIITISPIKFKNMPFFSDITDQLLDYFKWLNFSQFCTINI